MRARLVVLVPFAVVGLASSTLAAPPGSQLTFTTYTGSGSTHDFCDPGAECDATWTADGTTGVSKAYASYERVVAVPGHEQADASAAQKVLLRVPAKATKVTVTFTWDILAVSTEATSTEGRTWGMAQVTGSAPACRPGSGCGYTATETRLGDSTSDYGIVTPGTPTPDTATVTVTVTGALPRQLSVESHLFALASGQPARYCLDAPECQTVDQNVGDNHAGTASASVEAKLLKAEVVYG